jgi:3-phenylpropionate/trans-cinnamate dioxygenase ferredoxin reductase subunit
MSRVVIIGAGHAGGSAAALLRQYEYRGEIVLIGEEPVAPYQRPPLSKAYLKGEVDFEKLQLKADAFYVENDIRLHLGRTVHQIDRQAKHVVLGTGETWDYDTLIIATGSIARALPVKGADFKGVLALRSVADANYLRQSVAPGKRVVIIGGGYVGLEVAASVRGMGAQVTLIEREDRCLARVACEPLSSFFEEYHQARGVAILKAAGVSELLGTALEPDARAQVTGVKLADGRTTAADLVVVGVGASPRDELARAAGLTCENGIVVDKHARTSDPDTFAIGDVTLSMMAHYDDRRFRLESAPNALEQSKLAASAITDHPAPPFEVPWFWSDQYDLKLQIAGVPFGATDVLVRGDRSQARFAVFHLAGDRVVAVEAVNSAPEFMVGRQLIANRRAVSREKLANAQVSMKDIYAA